eukprot:scaffold287235_cov29-Prasinocladus_malaysianus.AAC.2
MTDKATKGDFGQQVCRFIQLARISKAAFDCINGGDGGGSRRRNVAYCLSLRSSTSMSRTRSSKTARPGAPD